MKNTYTKELYKMAREATAIGGSCAMSTSTLSALLDELDRLHEASRWIPVSERLPETQHIQIAFGSMTVSHGFLFERDGVKYWFDSFMQGEYSFDTITHWKLLPTPPEGE